jgi:predicted acyl esterase
MKRLPLAFAILFLAATFPARATPPYSRIDAMVPMSDGVAIDASLYLPAHPIPTANGKLPLIVRQHGGGSNKNSSYDVLYGLKYVETGKFALLMYSVRGHGNSGGLFDFFGPRTTQDFSEMLNWVAHTKGSEVDTNNVGASGISQGGGESLLPTENDARVKAIGVGNTFDDLNHALNPNDCFKFAFATGIFVGAYTATATKVDEALPVRWGSQFYTGTEDVGAGPVPSTTADLHSRSPLTYVHGNPDRSATMYRNGLHVPVFWMQSYEDQLFPPDLPLSILNDLRARHIPVHLWYSSGGHAAGGDFLPDQRAKEAAMLDWMDEFLRGTDHGFRPSDAHQRPLVDYWERVAPGEPGQWEHHTASTWVRGARAAHFSVGTGSITNDLASLNFAHDSISKEIFERTAHGPVGVLESFPESPNPIDTMRWSSSPLTSALHVAGAAHIHLPVSTTAQTVAQVSVKLWDVSAAGEQLIARGCRSFESPRSPFDFYLWPNAHTFPAGHRIELSISAVDFPTFEADREPQQTTILPGARLDLPLAS